MGPHDDPEAFVDLFEKTAEACGWARSQWPVRLIPLLTGEAQVAAQQLPVANLLAYEDLKRAILQRIGQNPEQHRQRFRSVELGDYGRPNFSDLTSPLTDLTKKEAPDPVHWMELCQQALTKVKAALCGGPLLHSPNFDLPFLLQTDASDRGLGAVLAQVVGERSGRCCI